MVSCSFVGGVEKRRKTEEKKDSLLLLPHIGMAHGDEFFPFLVHSQPHTRMHIAHAHTYTHIYTHARTFKFLSSENSYSFLAIRTSNIQLNPAIPDPRVIEIRQ